MISNDKLFVVIMVMAIVFAGLGTYLFLIDRKLSRIEKKHKEWFVREKSKLIPVFSYLN